MTGGNSPRVKGFSFERSCVNWLKDNGIKAKRTPSSKYPDLWVNSRPVECKRAKRGLKWAYDSLLGTIPGQDGHDYILFKADRMPVLKISLWGMDK